MAEISTVNIDRSVIPDVARLDDTTFRVQLGSVTLVLGDKTFEALKVVCQYPVPKVDQI